METRKMKPILFSTPMVQKLLAGEKTVTRRVIAAVEYVLNSPVRKSYPDIPDEKLIWTLCDAPYEPGDILWVRETWLCREATNAGLSENCIIEYKADGVKKKFDKILALPTKQWRPSIFMPREAARIFLRVAGVRVERLQEITGEQVIREGVDNGSSNPAMGARWENMQRTAFADLWNSINAKREGGAYAWENNPWVWVIEFERVEEA